MQGAEDSLESEFDTASDYIRRILVEDVREVVVRKSYEQEEPQFQDSLIVISKNETDEATDNQYSVTRYWVNT